MIKKELTFPNPEILVENIQICSESQPHPEHANAVLELAKALVPYERQGTVKGFRTWLLAAEEARQTLLWNSVPHLVGAPQTEFRIRHGLQWLSNWPRTPARVISWNGMLKEVRGKTVALANGAFRKLPTPAQIEFIRDGIISGERMEKNILVLEPSYNISTYKTSTDVFPKPLRNELWKHITLLDLVVHNTRFTTNDVFTEWKKRHSQIRAHAKKYEPIREYFDTQPDAWQRGIARGDSNLRGRVGFVAKSNYLKPEWENYSTGQWESVCVGEQKFVDIATRFLVTKQG